MGFQGVGGVGWVPHSSSSWASRMSLGESWSGFGGVKLAPEDGLGEDVVLMRSGAQVRACSVRGRRASQGLPLSSLDTTPHTGSPLQTSSQGPRVGVRVQGHMSQRACKAAPGLSGMGWQAGTVTTVDSGIWHGHSQMSHSLVMTPCPSRLG